MDYLEYMSEENYKTMKRLIEVNMTLMILCKEMALTELTQNIESTSYKKLLENVSLTLSVINDILSNFHPTQEELYQIILYYEHHNIFKKPSSDIINSINNNVTDEDMVIKRVFNLINSRFHSNNYMIIKKLKPNIQNKDEPILISHSSLGNIKGNLAQIENELNNKQVVIEMIDYDLNVAYVKHLDETLTTDEEKALLVKYQILFLDEMFLNRFLLEQGKLDYIEPNLSLEALNFSNTTKDEYCTIRDNISYEIIYNIGAALAGLSNRKLGNLNRQLEDELLKVYFNIAIKFSSNKIVCKCLEEWKKEYHDIMNTSDYSSIRKEKLSKNYKNVVLTCLNKDVEDEIEFKETNNYFDYVSLYDKNLIDELINACQKSQYIYQGLFNIEFRKGRDNNDYKNFLNKLENNICLINAIVEDLKLDEEKIINILKYLNDIKHINTTDINLVELILDGMEYELIDQKVIEVIMNAGIQELPDEIEITNISENIYLDQDTIKEIKREYEMKKYFYEVIDYEIMFQTLDYIHPTNNERLPEIIQKKLLNVIYNYSFIDPKIEDWLLKSKFDLEVITTTPVSEKLYSVYDESKVNYQNICDDITTQLLQECFDDLSYFDESKLISYYFFQAYLQAILNYASYDNCQKLIKAVKENYQNYLEHDNLTIDQKKQVTKIFDNILATVERKIKSLQR